MMDDIIFIDIYNFFRKTLSNDKLTTIEKIGKQKERLQRILVNKREEIVALKKLNVDEVSKQALLRFEGGSNLKKVIKNYR